MGSFLLTGGLRQPVSRLPGRYLSDGPGLDRFPLRLAHGFFGHLHAKPALLRHRRMTLSFGNGHRTE
jgi:hypothetical protein